jgi:hypothetical protein
MKKNVAYVVVLAALVSACAKQAAVEANLLDACSPTNIGKDVATSGYLDDKGGSGLLCSNPGTTDRPTCGYAVLTDPGGEKVFSAFIDQGIGKNRGEKPPAGYKKEDLKIRDDKGDLISLSNKVKLTGKMTVLAERGGCYMAVDKIER